MSLLVGARVIDPASGYDGVADVLVRDGRIEAVGADLQAPDAERIDCAGLVLTPGFVDLHTHLREPGREDAETVATGTRAAARGGYTAVCPMANTDPVADSAAVVEQVVALGAAAGRADVHPVGAITVGLQGERLAELGEMAHSRAQVRMFSDDGRCVADSALMRRAFEYATTFDAIIANHAEDPALCAGGQMHEGEMSQALGLRGIPAEAEEITVARDLALARLTGARYHVLHVSTAAGVDLVRAAKAAGTRVTAEVTPHHLSLTHESIAGYDPVFKVAPPLRTKADIDALIEGLRDGTIDCVATDHAPHPQHDKEREFDQAPCGMLGLETALSVLLTDCADLGLPRIIDALSTAPARIRGVDAEHGSLAAGTSANLTIFDPAASWEVIPEALASKSRNTPFAGRRLMGRIMYTMYRGRFTVREGSDHG